MKLRDHPLMTYHGVRNWPPMWAPVAHEGEKTLNGEIGILKRVDCQVRFSNRCFLTIEVGGESYVGTLLFDDATFCWLVGRILQKNIGDSTKDVGDLDLSFTL
jgi:hypothetical protein